MPKKKRASPLIVVVADLMLLSGEIVARRAWMMAAGTCSAAEYRRMVSEKMSAAYRTSVVLATKRGKASAAAALAPWHRGVVANAQRLRKRRRAR